MSLCRIEVITSLAKFSSLKSALSKAGVRGMTVMQVLGCGVEKGTREYEVDENYEMELLPHICYHMWDKSGCDYGKGQI